MSLHEDEIDLRPYLLTILKNWRLIAVFTIMAGAAAFAYSWLQPRTYEATASILLTRTRTTLTLAEQFPTITEPIDTSSRMDALLAIIQSDALAHQTIQALDTEFSTDYSNLKEFKSRVTVSRNGDVISIIASAENPEQAAEIANIWARESVVAINQAYSSEQPLGEIQAQLLTARSEYESAQKNLEAFINDNQIEVLNKRIDEAYLLFSSVADERARQIAYFTQRKNAMEDLEIRAQALLKQIQSGSQTIAAEIGDALAVLKMRTIELSAREIFTDSIQVGSSAQRQSITGLAIGQLEMDGGMVFNIQVDEFSNLLDPPQDQIRDLETIIQISQEEQAWVIDKVESLSQQVLIEGGNDTVNRIGAYISELETQLEREQARNLELSSQRDLAWQAYQAIAQKETEIRTAPQTINQVNLASQAIPRYDPISRGIVLNTFIAVVLGMFLATFWLIAVHWWRLSDNGSKPDQPTQELEQEN
jgi:uncharacterized protein involved in exopolysaccharide biosynthesis